jgi:glucan phosphorylase
MTKHIYVKSIEEATMAILDNYQDLSTRIRVCMANTEKPLPADQLAKALQENMQNIINAVNEDGRLVFLPNGDVWLVPTNKEE